MADETILTLAGMGIPPYSARGLTQTLEHINQAVNMRRTINGTLRDISDESFRKYKSSINGEDMDPPEIDDVWPGLILTVGCIVEIGYDASSTSRSAVPGSTRMDENGFRYYRPLLTMMVVGFSVSRDEYGAAVSWRLDLEEV